MMTWGEFKACVEAAGYTDADTTIKVLDLNMAAHPKGSARALEFEVDRGRGDVVFIGALPLRKVGA